MFLLESHIMLDVSIQTSRTSASESPPFCLGMIGEECMCPPASRSATACLTGGLRFWVFWLGLKAATGGRTCGVAVVDPKVPANAAGNSPLAVLGLVGGECLVGETPDEASGSTAAWEGSTSLLLDRNGVGA